VLWLWLEFHPAHFLIGQAITDSWGAKRSMNFKGRPCLRAKDVEGLLLTVVVRLLFVGVQDIWCSRATNHR